MKNFSFENFNFSQFNPSVIQNAMKMLNYMQGNMQTIQKVISEDPNLTSPEATKIINDLGEIKYPNKSYLDRQKLVKQEIEELLPGLKSQLKLENEVSE